MVFGIVAPILSHNLLSLAIILTTIDSLVANNGERVEIIVWNWTQDYEFIYRCRYII